MSIIDLFSIAVGVSMDACAVAACIGLGFSGDIKDKSLAQVSFKSAVIVGLYFGFFQAAMPLIGYFAGFWLSNKVADFGPWVAFFILLFIGGKMVKDSFDKSGKSGGQIDVNNLLKIKKMLPLAVATSIDALAVGVSFAFVRVNIFPAVSFIGAVTFVLSAAAVKIGGIFGTKFKSKAEFAGGAVLIVIGAKILIEYFPGK